jgi:phosphate uptake regulator
VVFHTDIAVREREERNKLTMIQKSYRCDGEMFRRVGLSLMKIIHRYLALSERQLMEGRLFISTIRCVRSHLESVGGEVTFTVLRQAFDQLGQGERIYFGHHE